jgi:hypothetical protein|tara:strand:+ start:8296 stop:8418 length:123 start_codon:yes stop_codon:yes gene_type:complete
MFEDEKGKNTDETGQQWEEGFDVRPRVYDAGLRGVSIAVG